VLKNKLRYLFDATKIEKSFIVTEIIADIRSDSPPGRFLEIDRNQRCWIEIGDLRARQKVGQCFREKTRDNSSEGARQSASSSATRFLRTSVDRNNKSFIFLSRAPPLYVPPEFNGPITMLNCNDVLCGRGKPIDSNQGNVKLRDCVLQNKIRYLFELTNIEKAYIIAEIIAFIRSQSPPGRFLKKDLYRSCWIEIGDQGARKKVGQCFRETKEMRMRSDSHNSDE
jgi:hypothetical protein